jgi:predicted DNA-binding protein
MANNTKETLSVRIGEALLQRVNKVAGALGKSQTQFVKEVLDERTKPHKVEVEEIVKLEKKIVEREKKRSK